MVRPPKPSEVFVRYAHPPDRPTLQFFDRYLCRFRWVDAVFQIGVPHPDRLRALSEFHPDAEVVGVDGDRNRLLTEGRITSHCLDTSDAHQMDRFAREYAHRFSVILSDLRHRDEQLLVVRLFRSRMRLGSLLVLEGASESDWEADGLRVEGAVAYYLKMEG